MKTLKPIDRQNAILTALRQSGSQTVADLAVLVGVSEETIRRDAQQLQTGGQVEKHHGSLSLPHNMSEASYERRMRESAPAKIAIAKAAAQMVRDGETLIIDTGTTTTFFARELRQRRNLTVITNSTEVARALADVPGNKVWLAGGEIQSDSGATYGPMAVNFIAQFRVKHAFISITAVDIKTGPMDHSVDEAQFAAMAISRATHRVVLADSSKFGNSAFAKVCDFSEIEIIVTEQSPPAEYFAVLRDHGTRLVIATI
jgi:DeoR family transcriptional regulator, glycerol-3-phosphate regulon repressor